MRCRDRGRDHHSVLVRSVIDRSDGRRTSRLGCASIRRHALTRTVDSVGAGRVVVIASPMVGLERVLDASQNPIDDRTGADCALNQPRDVWFLAGTYGGAAERACAIPAGRPVYLPVLNQICTIGAAQTVSSAITDCSAAESVATTTATLDGKPLAVTAATSIGAFPFTAQPNSSSGFSVGVHEAVAWGLWVGPLALPAGAHLLAFEGKTGSFSTTATYALTVS